MFVRERNSHLSPYFVACFYDTLVSAKSLSQDLKPQLSKRISVRRLFDTYQLSVFVL